MWNLKEIKEKQKYALERLKRADKKEKEKLELSLLAYHNMLNANNIIRYTKFYNLMYKITNNKFSIKKEQEYEHTIETILEKSSSYMDEEYLEFLITLAENINQEETEDIEFETMNITEEENINISKSFYRNLGNQEIIKLSNEILNSKDQINFYNEQKSEEKYQTATYEDYIFNKSYHTIIQSNSIFDYQKLNHEIMHGIDFKMNAKLPSENYYGFHEVPTYTIDYLFIEFLENIGFDSKETEKLKKQKENYLEQLARKTIKEVEKTKILHKNINKRGITGLKLHQIMSQETIANLLEIESGVIAYILYNQIKENKNHGLNNLVKFMKTNIDKNKKPNFSFIDISDNLILETSNNLKETRKLVKRNR